MYVIRPKTYIVRSKMYIIRPKTYIIRPNMYIIRPNMYILGPKTYVLRPKTSNNCKINVLNKFLIKNLITSSESSDHFWTELSNIFLFGKFIGQKTNYYLVQMSDPLVSCQENCCCGRLGLQIGTDSILVEILFSLSSNLYRVFHGLKLDLVCYLKYYIW